MAGHRDRKDEGTAALFRVRVRASDGRESTSRVAVVIGEGGEKEAATPLLYRFKVRAPDGREIASTVVVGRKNDLKVSNLRWGSANSRHGEETSLHAHLDSHHGGPVRFVVEVRQGGRWRQYATLPATVKSGEAVATLSLQHPTFSTESIGAQDGAGLARLRFKVERADANRSSVR